MNPVIIQTGFLGDAVLASGLLRAVHGAGFSSGLVVRPDAAELFQGHPAIERLHVVDKRRRGATSQLIDELHESGYDAAVIPHRSFRSAWVATRAGIPIRIGFRQSAASWLFTDRVEYRLGEHEVERNARLLAPLGISGESIESWLVPDPVLAGEFRGRYGDQPTVVVAPGSVWPTKQWTVDGFVEVARRLRTQGSRVLFAGGPSERSLCEHIAVGAGIGSEDVLAARMNLRESLALFSCVDRVICNDSAPLHIAESVSTPVTAIFGPTHPGFGFAPRHPQSRVVEPAELACRPCRIHGSKRCPIGTHECMRSIPPEQVWTAGRLDDQTDGG